ncbi:MAG: hypothetical protein ACYTEZ_11185 [Planctomycetota bacterium]|jgi:hypothetical protein
MRAQSVHPLAILFLPAVTAISLATFWLSLKGSAVPAVAIAMIALALIVLLVSPRSALFLLAATRFSFDMAWQHKISGLGVLDLLGAGVPAGVLILLLLSRPRLGHLPLVRPVAAWVGTVWFLAMLALLSGGPLLITLESALKFTSGAAIFVLAALVVKRFGHALNLLLYWIAGTVPVVAAFLFYGGSRAMEYHGVQRLRALYHDPGTPAIVTSLGLLGCLALIRIGRQLGWKFRFLVVFGFWALVLGRVLFLTFSGAMTASTILAILTLLILERRWGWFLCAGVILFAFWQLPVVQQRWHREASILEGREEMIAFASGRPHRWKRFLRRYEDSPPVDKIVGAFGKWGNPENGFLHVGLDLGPIGATATAVMLIWIAFSLLRWWREESRPEIRHFHGLTISVAFGYLVAWVTATPFTWINLQWFLWSCIGAGAALRVRPDEEGEPEAVPRP